MASDKDKDKKSKAEDKKLAAKTAAKKKKEDDSAAAQVVSTFMAPGSAAPSEPGSEEEEERPSRSGVDAASPAPSTGTGELEEAPQHTTQLKDSGLPEYLKFDVLEPSPKANNASKLHHERAKAAHL
eukprot:2965855-Rhodomonas_salina.1